MKQNRCFHYLNKIIKCDLWLKQNAQQPGQLRKGFMLLLPPHTIYNRWMQSTKSSNYEEELIFQTKGYCCF